MTITEIARQLDVSTMTIYRRLKRCGVDVGDLRDSNTGDLTAQGASVIASMFATGATNAQQQDVTGDTVQGVTDATGDDSAVLRAQLDGARALIAQLERERDDLRQRLDAMTAALEREQRDRQLERSVLTAATATAIGDEHAQRRGWIARMFGRENRQ